METEIKTKLEQQDAKLDAIFKSVEKTRKYFLIITWVTIALVVLPTFALIFVIPTFLKTYTGSFDGLI